MKQLLLPLLFCAAVVFSGCIDYEQKTHLAADGSGGMTIHYWTKETAVSYLDKGDLPFDETRARSQYGALPGVKVHKVSVTTRDKDSTRHVTIELSFDDIRRLSKQPGFAKSTFTWEPRDDGHVFTQTLDGDGDSDESSLKGFGVTYTYEFPGDVLASNATTASGATAVWKFRLSDLAKTQKLTATIGKGSGSAMMLAALAAVMVVIVVVFVLRRRKRTAPTV